MVALHILIKELFQESKCLFLNVSVIWCIHLNNAIIFFLGSDIVQWLTKNLSIEDPGKYITFLFDTFLCVHWGSYSSLLLFMLLQ